MEKSAVYEAAAAGLGRNTSYATAMKPGHMHDMHELFFLMDGNMTAVCNGRSTQVSGPAVLIFPRYSIHSGSSPDEGLYDRFILTFRDELLECGSPLCAKARFFSGSALTAVPLNAAQKQLLVALAERIGAYAGDSAAQEHLTLWCLYELAGWYTAPAAECAAPRQAYIDRVVQYLAENHREPLRLEELADRFFVSRAKLVADFKAVTGMTVKGYLALIRLCSAKALLDSGTGVAQTAAQAGYADESYFIDRFARHFGITPGEYLRRLREKG
ncbi:MAG: helix-turn-helix domain-containing protein [Oscillospiraceae bacterium]|nr:helix-turn-helix domain-containing protein [Oscillospiraceae bacterium]